jgi:hypothetical protein
MDIQLPKVDFTDLLLAPAEPPTRGEDSVGVDQVVKIGGPVSLPVTPSNAPEDQDAKAFIEARSTQFSFHIVYLALTARPPDDEPLEKIVVSLALAREDDGTPAPIAVSMTPRVLDQPVELSRTVRIGAQLKVVDANVEHAEKRMINEVHVRAFNELRADPYWEIYRTKMVKITGSQRFCMVVQAPRATCVGTVSLQALVRGRRFGILPYVGTPRDGTPITFPVNAETE